MTREELVSILKKVQEHEISVAKADELIYGGWVEKEIYDECYRVKERGYLIAIDADSAQKAATVECKRVLSEIAALEKEREGEVLIAMGPLDIESYATDKGGYLPDIHIDEGDKMVIDGKQGQLIFRPTKAKEAGK